MIVYGWRSVQTAKEEIPDCNCNNCGKPFTLSIYVFHNYVHVFWIPLFPIGKTVKSHCSACGLPLKKKEMPEDLRLAYRNMKKRNRIPVWMFSGLLLIAAGILWNVINNAVRDHHSKTMMETPLPGDVYEAKQDNGSYTTYKVKHIAGDTVYLLLNEYTSDAEDGMSQLKSMEYNDTAEAVLRSQLVEMFRNGAILKVDRNE